MKRVLVDLLTLESHLNELEAPIDGISSNYAPLWKVGAADHAGGS